MTGTDTALGRAVLQHLRVDQAVTSTVRVDLAEYDLRERLRPGVLDGADVVVYCALEPALNRNEDLAFARAVHGCRNLGGLKNGLDIVAKIGARKLVVVSSALVYGAHQDNELSLTEDAALRTNPDFAFAYQLMLAEQLVEEWADGHPAVTVTVLRPAITLGPGIEGFMARHLESPRLPLIRGQSAPLQFVHVDDVAAAVRLAVATDLPGTFNVAADGWLPVTEVCAILGRRPITFPEATAFEAVRRLWGWGLWHMPPGALHYLMYPCVVTPTGCRRTTGRRPGPTGRFCASSSKRTGRTGRIWRSAGYESAAVISPSVRSWLPGWSSCGSVAASGVGSAECR